MARTERPPRSADTGQEPGREVRAKFGGRVRALRLQRGFTQESLAEAAGLHRNYVGSLERGERNVSIENVHLLASALGVPASDLFLEDE
ncbi:MAG: helix-turn-helix transcriptional regulator [Acidimicrobiales bacterium]